MNTTLLLLLFSNALFNCAAGHKESGHREVSARHRRTSSDEGETHAQANDTGEPLFLTPLIQAGNYAEALERSRVGSIGDVPDVPSYSGFITVNEEYGSNLFFWFVPAMENAEDAPVMLWLNGGPGVSSLLGFFVEHGPYFVDEDFKPQLREITWTRRISILYVDSPVGTGFSFTQSDEGDARDLDDVSRDMLEFLQQFFTLFQNYSRNDFYLAGESYAGRYIPAIGTALHESRGQLRVDINLRGISLGNAVIDMVSLLRYGEYLFNLGLMDRQQATVMQEGCDRAANMIRTDDYEGAFQILIPLFFGIIQNLPTYFGNVTGYSYAYNYLYSETPDSITRYETFVQFPAVRRAIHVGEEEFKKNNIAVAARFGTDVLNSSKEQYALLCDNYKVMHYIGQLDIVVAYPFIEDFMQGLEWSGAQEFRNATQEKWRSFDGKILRGYARRAGDFTLLLVRNAGHLVPHDQPEAGYDAITRFIDDVPFVE